MNGAQPEASAGLRICVTDLYDISKAIARPQKGAVSHSQLVYTAVVVKLRETGEVCNCWDTPSTNERKQINNMVYGSAGHGSNVKRLGTAIANSKKQKKGPEDVQQIRDTWSEVFQIVSHHKAACVCIQVSQ